VPVGNVLVGDSGGNIEHDDTALTLNVVSVSETTELFLSGSVPDVEADGTEVGVESQRVDFDTESGCIGQPWSKEVCSASKTCQCTSSRIHRSSVA
jgi:hypothetical protein